MENEIGLIPLAVTPNASAHPIASRMKMRLDSPVLPMLVWLVAATTIIGCSGCGDALQSQASARPYASTDRSDRVSSEAGAQEIERSGRMLYGALLKRHERGEQRALRVKADLARNRLWVLGLEYVHVYDINGKQLIRRVALPPWSVAGIKCSPDMILDRSGSAFISSNAEPRLWKIDAEDFSIKEHAIRLHGKEGWDTGFGALAFAADGTLFALTAYAGSLWRIDIAKDSARMIARYHPPLNTCALTPQFLNSLERSRKSWMSPSPQQN